MRREGLATGDHKGIAEVVGCYYNFSLTPLDEDHEIKELSKISTEAGFNGRTVEPANLFGGDRGRLS